MTKRIYFILLSLSFVWIGCKSDRPPVKGTQNVSTGSGGVYVLNEGNFQFANASVTFYNAESKTSVEDIYRAVNGKGIGDVLQSVFVKDNIGYFVVNNSGKIELVEMNSFKSLGSFNGFISPRYFLPVLGTKAYVSDLYANALTIFDLSTGAISGSIPLKGWTEEMVAVLGRVYVTNKYSNKVYVINALTDQIEDSITVAYTSVSIKEDRYGKLWVLCEGDDMYNSKPSIWRIDPVGNKVEKTFELPSNEVASRLTMNQRGDTVNYLSGGMYKMSIDESTVPTKAFIAKEGRSFYALGIHPISGEIYLGDAVDFNQSGSVYRYSADGNLLDQFPCGHLPAAILFR